MKKEWKYIAFLGAAIILYLVMKLIGPRELDWTITFGKEDKNPFGGYVVHQLASDIFDDSVHHSMLTLYELYDSVESPASFISLSMDFSPGDEDLDVLLDNVSRGGNALICAQYFYGKMQDSLHVRTYDYFFHPDKQGFSYRQDTATLVFQNKSYNDETEYFYPRNNIHNYFVEFDSARSQVIATNDLDLPVTIRMAWGKGYLYLNSTPLAFTNAYMLYNHNPEFASRMLSLLPAQQPVYWTEFYQRGRLEAQTPLRYVLTTEPLKWAYYLMALSILLFMIFEAKRKQRIIPVIPPVSNTSLEFVETIGALYFQHGDHKDMAEKKINYFLEFIRSNYWVNTNVINTDLMLTVSKRSGNSLDDVKDLFQFFKTLESRPRLTEEDLTELNARIEKFHQAKK